MSFPATGLSPPPRDLFSFILVQTDSSLAGLFGCHARPPCSDFLHCIHSFQRRKEMGRCGKYLNTMVGWFDCLFVKWESKGGSSRGREKYWLQLMSYQNKFSFLPSYFTCFFLVTGFFWAIDCTHSMCILGCKWFCWVINTTPGYTELLTDICYHCLSVDCSTPMVWEPWAFLFYVLWC